MTGAEFSAKYKLLRRITTEGVSSYHAQHATTNQAAMVHIHPRTTTAELRAQLDQLDRNDRDKVIELVEVDGSAVVVTHFIQGFSTFEMWIDERVRARQQAREAGSGTAVHGFPPPPRVSPPPPPPVAPPPPPPVQFAPPPVARQAPPPPPPSEPGSFTQMFLQPSPGVEPSPFPSAPPPAPPPPVQGAFGSQRSPVDPPMQMPWERDAGAGSGLPPVLQPSPSPLPPPLASPPGGARGSFTELLNSPSPGQGGGSAAPPPPPMPRSAPPPPGPSAHQPSDFTRIVNATPGSSRALDGPAGAPPPRAAEAAARGPTQTPAAARADAAAAEKKMKSFVLMMSLANVLFTLVVALILFFALKG